MQKRAEKKLAKQAFLVLLLTGRDGTNGSHEEASSCAVLTKCYTCVPILKWKYGKYSPRDMQCTTVGPVFSGDGSSFCPIHAPDRLRGNPRYRFFSDRAQLWDGVEPCWRLLWCKEQSRVAAACFARRLKYFG